ncbi:MULTISPECIES: exopolysaccharide production repressor protein [unclassified Mesorhizobium]|uniref:exopolysaccharide production repressor protein n=1 Tax=unclassified Mesorhizobium TaxID=325217 RepID=UPI003334BF95
MSFLLFLRGFIIVLSAFAISIYLLTASLWSTFVQTLICGVLIQIGYFVAVMLLVWRSVSKESVIPKPNTPRDESEREQLPSHLVNKVDHSPPL